MILAREQINRYLRHILMPEISGSGQKKLLESSVLIYGESSKDIAPAVYYLAASGIGCINCKIDNSEGFKELSDSVHDLNRDVSIELFESSHYDFRIFLGNPGFIAKNRASVLTNFVPSVIGLYSGWKGGITVLKNADDLNFFLSKLSDIHTPFLDNSYTGSKNGGIFSNCISGALSTMELIKLSLGIGETADNFLYFDLLSMEFVNAGNKELDRILYGMQVPEPIDEPEIKLRDKKVLIVGTGGLGSPAAYALALSGMGTIGLVDYDVVDISNLNRQILHSTSRIGMPKVESAAVFLKNINPDLKINLYNTSLNKENVFDIVKDYDAVIDAVDNFQTRFLLNDACFFAGKPMLEAGVLRFDGTCMTVLPQKGPCYRCMLPAIPSPGSVPTCSEVGVLGPVPGIFGFIQSAEAVKLLSGQGNVLSGKIIFFDGLFSDFSTIELSRKSTCPLCGTAPAIHELQDYVFICRDAANGSSKAP